MDAEDVAQTAIGAEHGMAHLPRMIGGCERHDLRLSGPVEQAANSGRQPGIVEVDRVDDVAGPEPVGLVRAGGRDRQANAFEGDAVPDLRTARRKLEAVLAGSDHVHEIGLTRRGEGTVDRAEPQRGRGLCGVQRRLGGDVVVREDPPG